MIIGKLYIGEEDAKHPIASVRCDLPIIERVCDLVEENAGKYDTYVVEWAAAVRRMLKCIK